MNIHYLYLDSPALPVSEIVKGRESRTIGYNEDMYTPCGIAMTLNDIDLVAGETYTITMVTYNQNGNVYLSTSQDFEVQTISIPTPGTLEVKMRQYFVLNIKITWIEDTCYTMLYYCRFYFRFLKKTMDTHHR